MNTEQLVVSAGTNIGDRKMNLSKAQHLCKERLGSIVKTSGTYETEAWGIKNQQAFYNEVWVFETVKDPQECMIALLDIERKMGRVRFEKWGPRLIDIDILFYGNRVLNSAELTIPHKEIANRLFVLIPLQEVMPHFIHPTLGKSVTELVGDCSDLLKVERIDE